MVWQLVWQLVYTMFYSNNRPSFRLSWKENLVKHWKVSNNYETDCQQNFLLLCMFLLTTTSVKKSHILARIFFIFLKTALNETWNAFSTKFGDQWKDRKSSYQIRQAFAHFCTFIALELLKMAKKIGLKKSRTS